MVNGGNFVILWSYHFRIKGLSRGDNQFSVAVWNCYFFFFVCEVLSPLSQAFNDLSVDWKYLQLRVYSRTCALEQMVQAASSSAGLRTVKRVEQILHDLGVCSCFLKCEYRADTHFFYLSFSDVICIISKVRYLVLLFYFLVFCSGKYDVWRSSSP